MTARGRFIVFEGLDGSGSTTQARLLARWLADRGIAVESTREPTDGPFGAIVRLALRGRLSLSPEALALAFAADRRDHLVSMASVPTPAVSGGEHGRSNTVRLAPQGIVPWLEAGRWVVADRYVLSSLAYQYAQKADAAHLEWLKELNRGIVPPDATILISTPSEVCWERLQSRSLHLELFDSPASLRDVEQRYDIAVRHAREMGLLGAFHAVAGDRSVEHVSQKITRFLVSVFPELGLGAKASV